MAQRKSDGHALGKTDSLEVPIPGTQRRVSMPVTTDIRVVRAQFWQAATEPAQTPNGDEGLYPDRRASFTKGLPHGPDGLVDGTAYQQLLTALASGDPVDFAAIPRALGAAGRPFVSPQAGLGVELIGPDPKHLAMPAAPSFASAEIAGEIVENYWMALLRDVPFQDLAAGNPLVDAACADLTALGDFRGPKAGGQVTPATLFRGRAEDGTGNLMGPYLSQFMWLPVPFGAQRIEQTTRTALPGIDFMTDWASWLGVQNGVSPPRGPLDPVPRYIRSGRDLGEWVHVDQLYQAYFNACLILLEYVRPNGSPAVDAGNPYAGGGNQAGFATFGGAHILSLVTEVATRALKAVWYQKWAVHRRLRPEAYAARVHANKRRGASFDVHANALTNEAIDRVFEATGSCLLPMAFPEGSPLHPAYGAGHATVAGACVTILKAWFDEGTRLVELVDPTTGRQLVPVVASRDGLALERYTGQDWDELTIGGELDKLAANVGIGRNHAGVHWRSDYAQSIRLGEAAAIGTLADYACTFNEDFPGFALTTFDGRKGRVTKAGFVEDAPMMALAAE